MSVAFELLLLMAIQSSSEGKNNEKKNYSKGSWSVQRRRWNNSANFPKEQLTIQGSKQVNFSLSFPFRLVTINISLEKEIH